MRHLLRRTALVLAVAGQSVLAPAARITGDCLRPLTTVLQRAGNAVTTSPRWGHTLDRLAAATDVRKLLTSRSSS